MNKRIFFSLSLFVLGIFVISASTSTLSAKEKMNITKQLKVPELNYIQLLTLKDGSVIIGRIVEIAESEIKFKSDIGIITIPIENI